MTLRGWLYDRHGHPRLVWPGIVALALALGLSLLALRLFTPAPSEEERARLLLAEGDIGGAEAIYAARVKDHPTGPSVIALVELHQRAAPPPKKKKMPTLDEDSGFVAPAPSWSPRMPEAELDGIVAGLPPELALVARFLRGDPEATATIEDGADAEPPLPWANHLLGRRALSKEEPDELAAASRFFREGNTFGRSEDLDESIALYIDADAWDDVREKTADPNVMRALEPARRYDVAVRLGDWGGAFRAFPAMWTARFHGAALWLSAIAALAWALFCARLGRIQDRPLFRLPIYLLAFGLGVLSVIPTIALITVEEAKLHLVETGDLGRDAIVMVFGVGLREEASKLLLFLPLLPILRRWGDKLDVLACGAMVGLGFAAEENLGYLSGADAGGGLARFLTANFLHMAMTGTLASALDDFVRDGEKARPRDGGDFFKTSLMVVGLHGAYDLLLDHPEIGGGYAAMIVFVVLTKTFVDAIDLARKKAERGLTPVHAFIVALAIVTGASMAHTVTTYGAFRGSILIAGGVLGEIVMVVVFVRLFSFL